MNGGKKIYTSRLSSPLGGIVVTSDGEALTGLRFTGREDFSGASFAGAGEFLPVFDETRRWLSLYFGGADPGFTPKLRLDVTPFRKEVLRILLSVPYGGTTTYGAIAAAIARKRGIPRMSARAVGGAVGHNPISLIIPCHRVIGAGGNLVGYGGGLDRKVRLLELEGVKGAALFSRK